MHADGYATGRNLLIPTIDPSALIVFLRPSPMDHDDMIVLMFFCPPRSDRSKLYPLPGALPILSGTGLICAPEPADTPLDALTRLHTGPSSIDLCPILHRVFYL